VYTPIALFTSRLLRTREGGSTMTAPYRGPFPSDRVSRKANASAAIARAGASPLATTLRRPRASARGAISISRVEVAPPRMAWAENPPENAKQLRIERPSAIRPSSRRLSRWSRKKPVFCPLRTSAASWTSPSVRRLVAGDGAAWAVV